MVSEVIPLSGRPALVRRVDPSLLFWTPLPEIKAAVRACYGGPAPDGRCPLSLLLAHAATLLLIDRDDDPLGPEARARAEGWAGVAEKRRRGWELLALIREL